MQKTTQRIIITGHNQVTSSKTNAMTYGNASDERQIQTEERRLDYNARHWHAKYTVASHQRTADHVLASATEDSATDRPCACYSEHNG